MNERASERGKNAKKVKNIKLTNEGCKVSSLKKQKQQHLTISFTAIFSRIYEKHQF